jgi:tetratricopeptide (TPR) repeat protein
MSKTEPPRPFDKSPGERRKERMRDIWLKLTSPTGLTIAGLLLTLCAISGYTFRDLLFSEVPTTTPTTTPTVTHAPTATPLPTTTSTPTITPTPWPFEPGAEGEVLVIVTDFDQTGEIIADNRIYRALRERVAESELEKVRVERLEGVMPLTADEAIAVGEQYHATIVIWGTADNVAFEPRYVVIAHSDLIPYRMELELTIATGDTASFNARIAQEAPLEFEYLMLFSLGQVAYFSGEYEEAVALYSQALDLLPSFPRTDSLDPEVLYDYRGIARYAQDDLEGAIADFSRAININPEYADGYNNRGWAYYRQGEYETAIVDYTRAIELDPESAGAYIISQGLARYAQGDLEGAIADFSRAIELDPDDSMAYILRGITRARPRLGDLEGAIADFDRAIELDPEYFWAYHNRGLTRYDQGDLEGAIADYNRAIELDPEYTPAYYNRGIARKAQGDLEGAIADYTQAIELWPEYVWAYYDRGWAYYRQGEYEAAIADYTRAIELDPEYADAYYGRALIYDDQGNVEAALADYIRFLELEDTEDWYTARARERIEALRAE